MCLIDTNKHKKSKRNIFTKILQNLFNFSDDNVPLSSLDKNNVIFGDFYSFDTPDVLFDDAAAVLFPNAKRVSPGREKQCRRNAFDVLPAVVTGGFAAQKDPFCTLDRVFDKNDRNQTKQLQRINDDHSTSCFFQNNFKLLSVFIQMIYNYLNLGVFPKKP